jgi:hypothetical protein
MLRGNPSVLAPASNPGLIDLPRRGSFPRGQYNGSIRFMSTQARRPEGEIGQAETAPPGHVDDFDFLVGRWRVRHRRLVGRLVGSIEWEEFEGECTMHTLLDRQANVDDNVLYAPARTYRALTIRVFDPGTHAWSIYWIDSRYPSARIENPVVGGFAGGRGLFFCDDEWEGLLVRTRFVWHVEGPDSCHWEQALSPDRGATWETNWTMDFERISS